jgi:hypothetical protein
LLGFTELTFIAGNQGYPRAMPGQLQGDLLAQTPAGPGDNSHLTI